MEKLEHRKKEKKIIHQDVVLHHIAQTKTNKQKKDTEIYTQ